MDSYFSKHNLSAFSLIIFIFALFIVLLVDFGKALSNFLSGDVDPNIHHVNNNLPDNENEHKD